MPAPTCLLEIISIMIKRVNKPWTNINGKFQKEPNGVSLKAYPALSLYLRTKKSQTAGSKMQTYLVRPIENFVKIGMCCQHLQIWCKNSKPLPLLKHLQGFDNKGVVNPISSPHPFSSQHSGLNWIPIAHFNLGNCAPGPTPAFNPFIFLPTRPWRLSVFWPFVLG